jgi:hypothetical protein
MVLLELFIFGEWSVIEEELFVLVLSMMVFDELVEEEVN